MSELDQLYQEFYAQVTTNIWADYEDFKKKKSYLTSEEQVRQFKDQLKKTILSLESFPELNPIRTGPISEEGMMFGFAAQFKEERKKYRFDPVFYYFQDNEKNLLETFPIAKSIQELKEIITKFFASKEALNDFISDLKIDVRQKNSLIPMTVKQTLRKWLADGENDRVVDALQDIAERFGDTYFVNDVTFQAGRYASLKKRQQQNVISEADAGMELARIRQALLDMINKVPDNATLDIPYPEPDPINKPLPLADAGNVLADKPTDTKPEKQETTDLPNEIKPGISPHIPWIIGLGLLLVATLLAAMIPCPDENLSLVSRILVALGAAGIATILPGFLHLNLPNVKAGSAIAVFALIYLVNPAKAIENNSACNKEPFEFTINLQQDRNIQLSNQYPKLENATLQIWIANDWKDAKVDANNLARYFSLPGDYKDEKVAAQLDRNTKYWKLAQDSVTLTGKSQTLTVVPDGTLGTVTGKIRSENNTAFLSGVEVEIEGELDTTDTRGNFTIQIPLEKQKTRYFYTTQKAGYQTKTEPFEFDGEAIEIRLKKQ